MEQTWPQLTSFAHDNPDMLRAFFHLASQIQRRSQDEIGVGAANLHFAVKPANIDLCRGKRLLPRCQPLPQLGQLWSAFVRES